PVAEPAVYEVSRGIWVQPAGGLSAVGGGRWAAVPALRMVRGGETASSGWMVELPLNSPDYHVYERNHQAAPRHDAGARPGGCDDLLPGNQGGRKSVYGNATAKVSLKRLVQLARPTVAARTTSWLGAKLFFNCSTTAGSTFPCRVHCSANRNTAFSRSL